MPCEVLIAGTAHRKQIRGRLWSVQDTPAAWGAKELETPHYAIATISDATAAQVRPFIAVAGETDTWTGPRYIMTPPEVIKANGKTYTLTEFTSFLVDQS